LPECVVCGDEVDVNPYKKYVYINLNFGVPGKEKPFYFHIECFSCILRKESRLWREIIADLLYLR
jgi:hypothetical protein